VPKVTFSNKDTVYSHEQKSVELVNEGSNVKSGNGTPDKESSSLAKEKGQSVKFNQSGEAVIIERE
jgi:hypothetical protein